MTIGFDTATFQQMITNFSKTLSRTPVTKTTDNLTGDETLSDGTPANISGAFYRQEDIQTQDVESLFQGADAILMVLPSVTINKNDKITYDSETYRIDKEPVTRRLGTSDFYKLARLYKIS